MYQQHNVKPASTCEVAAGLASGLPPLLSCLACCEALNCSQLLCISSTVKACKQGIQAFERLVGDSWRESQFYYPSHSVCCLVHRWQKVQTLLQLLLCSQNAYSACKKLLLHLPQDACMPSGTSLSP